MIGFAAEIFFIPVLIVASIGLAITIIGIPFVAVFMPLAIVLGVFAFVLGFTALACRLGEWIEDRLGWQPGNAFIATAIGFIVLLAPTLIARDSNVASDPWRALTFLLVAIGLTVEFVAWTIGLGAAILTGLGRWYTVPPPITCSAGAPELPSAWLTRRLKRRLVLTRVRGRGAPGAARSPARAPWCPSSTERRS